jgi:membrane-bound metal-dependent hydrolase YbcI (DUF457 family)
MAKQSLLNTPRILVGGFATLNVLMYITLQKFWIGGSSFLPMIGQVGPDNALLFAFIVNLGVILGAFVGAVTSGEFRVRWPKRRNLWRAIAGGFLIGVGITLAPGTCTTVFVTGMPMLSASSFLSAAGIFIGAYIVYRMTREDDIG